MSYLVDYLKVLPEQDRNRVYEYLKQQVALFEAKELKEEELARLLEYLVIEQTPLTGKGELGEKISSKEWNEYYGNVLIDLVHLFQEQQLLEEAMSNHTRIYKGHLQELSESVELLRKRYLELELEEEQEKGFLVKLIPFSSQNQNKESEKFEESTAYLYIDRDGSSLPCVEYDRTFHDHYVRLPITNKEDRIDREGLTPKATVKITYQTPGTLEMDSLFPISYSIDKSNDSAWRSICLKESNGLDRVDARPGRYIK